MQCGTFVGNSVFVSSEASNITNTFVSYFVAQELPSLRRGSQATRPYNITIHGS